MEAKVAPVADQRHHRVGDSADSDLNRRPVLDIARDVLRDRLLYSADWLRLDLRRPPRSAHYIIDPRQVDRAVTVGPRQLAVDLGDHDARPRDRGLLKIIREGVAVSAMLVGLAQLNQHYVGRDDALREVA